MPISDTTPEAEEMQLRILRSKTGGQRLLLALEMSLFAKELAKARIRQEHPEWSEKQIMIELIRLAFFPAPLPAWVR